MRKVHNALAGLLLAAILIQFYIAGSGAFTEAPREEAFAAHTMLGRVILVVALLSAVTAAVARMPGRVTGLAFLIVGLGVVQSLVKVVADVMPTGGMMVFGVHAVNGLAMMGLAAYVFRKSLPAAAVAAGRTSANAGNPYGD